MECNNAKSRNDDFLRDLLASDIYGNSHPVAQRIFQNKVLSSARHGSSNLARTVIENSAPEPFYSHGGIYLGEAISAPFGEERIRQVFSTLVQGLYYNAHRQILPDEYHFEVTRFHPRQFSEAYASIEQILRSQNRELIGPHLWGEVFGYSFASDCGDFCDSVWLMWFYDRVAISVTATNPQAKQSVPTNPHSFGRRRN